MHVGNQITIAIAIWTGEFNQNVIVGPWEEFVQCSNIISTTTQISCCIKITARINQGVGRTCLRWSRVIDIAHHRPFNIRIWYGVTSKRELEHHVELIVGISSCIELFNFKHQHQRYGIERFRLLNTLASRFHKCLLNHHESHACNKCRKEENHDHTDHGAECEFSTRISLKRLLHAYA